MSVEWVEVAGKTVAEATEQALDQLGVAAADAEVIVLSEPKTGLFGRVRVEARVRARVRPVGVRPKRERSRDRGRSGRSRQGSKGSQGGQAQRTATKSRPPEASSGRSEGGADGGGVNGVSSAGGSRPAGSGTSRSARRRRNRSQAAVAAGSTMAQTDSGKGDDQDRTDSVAGPGGTSGRQASQGTTEPKETQDMAEGMTLEEQGEAGREFLSGLLAEYGVQASVEARRVDEDTVEIAATGDDLGTFVGPRGSTLSAVQDLTRAVVQRQCPSRTDRILVDVAGYREKRSAALKRFSTQVAEEVLASGQEKALEAMSPADRKAVHDAINELHGVVTRSEGEDPNRYIVIAPAG